MSNAAEMRKRTGFLSALLNCAVMLHGVICCAAHAQPSDLLPDSKVSSLVRQAKTKPDDTMQQSLLLAANPNAPPIQRAQAYALAAHTACLLGRSTLVIEYAQAGLNFDHIHPELKWQLQISMACGLDQRERSQDAIKILEPILAVLTKNLNPALYYEATRQHALALASTGWHRQSLINMMDVYTEVPVHGERIDRGDFATTIAFLNRMDENYELAERYLREAMELNGLGENLVLSNEINYEMAVILRSSNRPDDARTWFERSLTSATSLKSARSMALSYYGMAQLAIKNESFEIAERFFDLAEHYFLPETELKTVGYIHLDRARIAQTRQQINLALNDANKAYHIGSVGNHLKLMRESLKLRANLHHLLGHAALAQSDLEQAFEVFEADRKNENDREVADIKAVFDVANEKQKTALLKKDRDLHEAEENQTTTRIFIISIAMGFLLFGLGWSGFRLYRNQQYGKDLEKIAHTDALTCIPNRQQILAVLEHDFSASQKFGNALCVAMLDIDHFKLVNDVFGHEAGDEVLKAFAGTIRGGIREGDWFGRVGGEEFLLLLPSIQIESAVLLIHKLREAIEVMNVPSLKGERKISFSAGLTKVHPQDKDTKEVLARADKCLYRAKENGRQRTECDPVSTSWH